MIYCKIIQIIENKESLHERLIFWLFSITFHCRKTRPFFQRCCYFFFFILGTSARPPTAAGTTGANQTHAYKLNTTGARIREPYRVQNENTDPTVVNGAQGGHWPGSQPGRRPPTHSCREESEGPPHSPPAPPPRHRCCQAWPHAIVTSRVSA